MPIDKDGSKLQALVIMADLIVLFAGVVMLALQAFVMLILFAPYLLVGLGLSQLF